MTMGEKLKTYWQSQNMLLPLGISPERIIRFETQHQVLLPSDMRDYFVAVNGMVMHIPHDQDQNGFTFFPLEEIRTVEQESQRIKNASILFSGAESFFIFCDYLTWCWVYAIHLSNEQAKSNRVVIVGSQQKEPVIANSFSEFIDLYLCDSPKLYGGQTS